MFFHACLQAADCEYRLVPGLAVALEPVACVVLAAWLNKGTGRIPEDKFGFVNRP